MVRVAPYPLRIASTADSDRLDAALDELYGVEPGEFVATRKRLAGALRDAGDPDAAKQLQDARRPTTAAWALNQLRRRRPDLLDDFVDRSDRLRAAQFGAGPTDADATRAAIREQRDVMHAVLDEVMAVLGDRANESFRGQVLGTLQAATADETVAGELQTGRLTHEMDAAGGFPGGEAALAAVPARARPTTPAAKRAPPKKRPAKDEATRESEAAATRAREEAARQAEASAAEELRAAEAAWRAAARVAEAAEAEADVAQRHVDQLTAELDEARRKARTAASGATTARREAARLAREATKLRSRATP